MSPTIEGHINFELFQYATKLVMKEDRRRREAQEKRQKDLAGTKGKGTLGSISYGKLAIYGIIISILLYTLWSWVVWKFFWKNKDNSFQFGGK